MSENDFATGGVLPANLPLTIPDGCVLPDMTDWLDKLPKASITVHLGDQDLPEFAGRPVTNGETGERLGEITSARLTQDGDVIVEMKWDER